MRGIRLLLVLVVLALVLGPGTVLADDPPLGAVPADEPAMGPPPGYRIDEPSPGAVVHRVPVRPESASVEYLILDQYRSGWTDGWWSWHYPLDFDHVGSHTSDSDLVEEQIYVDGFLRVGDGGWDDSCEHHTTGTTAHCNTCVTYHLEYSFYAESHHFFHKTGYQDDYFETGKNVG